MRIHTNTLTDADVYAAARLARVELATFTRHGSKSRDHAYDVKLTGESRRRPNDGGRGAGDDYAATWDQWGVFLAALFDVDPHVKCWAYDSAETFHTRTADRFRDGWPEDAHGDHVFRWNGIPYESSCTKCSATQRWTAPQGTLV